MTIASDDIGAIPLADASTRQAGAWRWHLAALTLTLAGLAAAIVMGLMSNDVYHDDDICHYLIALDAWGDVNSMLSWWARPGYTIPAMFVAHWFGLIGCRIFSAILTGIVAWLAYCIARRIGVPSRWAALAPAFVWVQPLAMTLGMTTLTETPAALYITLAAWLYLPAGRHGLQKDDKRNGNPILASTVLSLCFITRLETLALAPLGVLAVLIDSYRRHGRKISFDMIDIRLWAGWLMLLWAPAVYAAASYVADVPRDISFLYVFFSKHTEEYGRGSWNHFLMEWPLGLGLGVIGLGVAGALRLGKQAWLAWSLAFGIVALQDVIYHFGMFASGGYARFLVPSSGLLGALAAGGAWVLLRDRTRRLPAAVSGLATLAMLWMIAVSHERAWRLECGFVSPTVMVSIMATMVLVILLLLTIGRKCILPGNIICAAMFFILIAIQAGWSIRPLKMERNYDPFHLLAGQTVQTIQSGPYADRPALTQHVLIRFLRPKTVTLFSNDVAIDRWCDAKPGTLFFWENKYSYKPFEMKSTERLYFLLNTLGRQIFSKTGPYQYQIEVYERLDESALPTSMTTSSASYKPTPVAF